jgi:DNA-binding transcriptional regulator YiaG
MTSDEFRAARKALGLSVGQLAGILGVEARTVRRWEQGDGLPPNPIASRVMTWLEDGFRPPEWPDQGRAGLGGNPNWIRD